MKVEELKIGEKIYPFYFGMAAIRDITKQYKVSLAGLGGFLAVLTIDQLVDITQAAIKQGLRLQNNLVDKFPTDLEILDGIDMNGNLLTKIPTLIGEQMAQIFPDDKKEEGGADENPAPEKK